MVGIGTVNPGAKLDIYKQAGSSGTTPQAGLRSTLIANVGTALNIAIDAYITRLTPMNVAVRATSVAGLRNYGVLSEAYGTHANYGIWSSGHDALNNYGIVASAYAGGSNIGVNGSAYGGSGYNYGVVGGASGINAWAGYFNGDVNVTGLVYDASDAMLKTNVQDMQGGLDVVMSLAPKNYSFLTEEYPQMNFPTGQQAGVLAEDLETVLPGLVKTAIQPAVLDSSGNVVTEQVEYSAVSYVGMIPYLVGAIQEQQATIAQLQDQINQCCASQGGGMVPDGNGNTGNTPQDQSDLQEERLLVQPNPFTDHTTVSYYVPKSGRVSLQVSNGDGRTLGTLLDEQADAGAYSYEWNTTQLTPGTYFCALLVDGNVVVKRAVKVAR